MSYRPNDIEKKWQDHWDTQKTFRTEIQEKSKPKYYVLDMFPYPSAAGLHVGHPEGYTATDIMARYKRAKGFNVLHPMGWDAFGLPAEQHALKTGVHPAIITEQAMVNFKRQLKSIGFSYDWEREISTCTPEYYRWTQTIFLKLYEKGLAYRKDVPVNWCPELKTVLANEEVVDGKSERGGHPVFRIMMKQWMLRITAYADRLLADLDALDWPNSTKELQRNWIGKSEGLEFGFEIDGGVVDGRLDVFTTRPDTIFGVSFVVVAPEHPMLKNWIPKSGNKQAALEAYVDEVSRKSEIARQDQTREKTGVETGLFAIHPLTQKKIPIYTADYVLMGYGTGAVMAVPAHDERDYEFAKQFGLPIPEVILKPEGYEGCYAGEGKLIDSGDFTGLESKAAQQKITKTLESLGVGKSTIKYKLRDWLFSRQRYWGEPIPVAYREDGTIEALTPADLPVELPNVQSYEPMGTGESPLAAIKDWVQFSTKAGAALKRETDTMPGSAGSSWYFLRYIDPKNTVAPWDSELEKHWMPVDLYLGGPEHAVGHLLYARFWMKVLFDLGLVSHSEPFQKLVHQGMILGMDGEKMSKSRGNVINPDDVIHEYGADTLRIYEMFMGPLERDKPWSTTAIEGTYRFLQRVYRLFLEDQADGTEKFTMTKEAPTEEDLRVTHRMIKTVTEDIEAMKFNTAISEMMVYVNHFTPIKSRPAECLLPLIQCLQPFAPHLCEELWKFAGQATDLSYTPWPIYRAEYSRALKLDLAVQILGKTRGTVSVDPDADQAAVEQLVRVTEALMKYFDGKTIRKTIFVKNKIINFILG